MGSQYRDEQQGESRSDVPNSPSGCDASEGKLPSTAVWPTRVATATVPSSLMLGVTTVHPEGIRRGTVVEKLCDNCTARGIHIIRDKNVLQIGDSIAAFVEDIGAADRIVVVMSKKYLESHWCMAELLEIWNYSRRNKDDFGRRVRVLCLPDVKISDIGEQLEHSSRWKQRYDCIVAKVDKLGDLLPRPKRPAAFATDGRIPSLYGRHPQCHRHKGSTANLGAAGAVQD